MATIAQESTGTHQEDFEEECDYTKTRAYYSRRIQAHPPPGEEVVISGLSGIFPDSTDVYHFRDNLMNKVDMISSDDRRWALVHPEIPKRTGKIYGIRKFDGGFFGTHYRQAQSLDPMARLYAERAIEAVFDAGLSPSELENTRTGVFVGACFCESEKAWFFDRLWPHYFGLTGCMRSMIPNRVSYFLKLTGPTFIVDTACSSSLYAVQHAYDAIRSGECDAAIVGGTNICVHPYVSLQFHRLGVLSPDGRCKVFDANGNGYARSEAICAAFLQKAKDARRVYSTIIHAKSNCDGYKSQGITFPSGPVQQQLLQEVYQECGYDPTTLSFLEAHGTGTKVGDPEEVVAIDEVFCKKRKTPLLIGSVKSNIGHTEPSSGLCSITKAILSMENDFILPNINYESPREGLEALEKGRLKVVTKKTPWEDDRGLVGVNSFGFGGGNCHILLKWNDKKKINAGCPSDDLPRLVCVSGRVEVSISAFLDDLKGRTLDAEFVSLCHQMHKKNIDGHNERGYSIVSKKGELKRFQRRYDFIPKPLCLIFGDFGSSLSKIANDLYVLPIFAACLQRVHNILIKRGINATELVLNGNCPGFGSGFVKTMSTAIVQIGIANILKYIDIVPKAYFSKGIGEFICAYFEGALDIEETVLGILFVAKKLSDTPAASYLLKLDKNQLKSLPPNVHVTEFRPDGVVLTGDIDEMRRLVSPLRNEGVDVEILNENALDFHGANYAKLKSQLLNGLSSIITKPRPKTSKWVSNTVTKSATAEHFVNSLSKIFSTKEILSNLRKKTAAVLEIGTSLKELEISTKTSLFMTFGKASNNDGFIAFLEILGSLYLHGHNAQIERLYPKITYPVSRGTPMISPLIKWNHSKDWFVTYYTQREGSQKRERSHWVYLKDDTWAFISGHLIDNRNLFPATGYLVMVWEALSFAEGIISTDMQVIFEDIKFMRATTVSIDSKVELTVMIQKGSGNFELIEGGTPIVTGKIYTANDFSKECIKLPLPTQEPGEEMLPMQARDAYKELRLRGYNYKGDFRNIKEWNANHCAGTIKWDHVLGPKLGNWITFMDSMLQVRILQMDTRLLYVPTSIKRLSIDAKFHITYAQSFGETPILPVYFYKDCEIIKSGGVEIRGLMANSIAKRRPRGEPVLEKYEFVPNIAHLDITESIRVNVQIALENVPAIKVKTVELIDNASVDGAQPLSPIIHQVLGDLPLIQPDISILTKNEMEKPNGVAVEDKKLVAETECTLVVGTTILQRAVVLHQAFGALKPGGFVLSREASDFDPDVENLTGIDIITIHTNPNEKLVMARRSEEFKAPAVVDVSNCSDGEFEWLGLLQKAMSVDPNVIAFSQNEPLSGVLGLVNCLRREPGFVAAKSVFVVDEESPQFDLSNPFYNEHLRKNLAVNVYKNSQWGTYRHLLLEESDYIEHEHSFVNVTTRGDLSSLRWLQGHLTSTMEMPSERELVHVYYTALNFRDVMTATGRINADVVTRDRLMQECVQGFEFSGRNQGGERVFGMVVSKALSTLMDADKCMLWKVPDHWTLEDAATIPVVYGTLLYTFYIRCQYKKGQSILIHAGSGGIGIAAITLALHEGLTVYTTVGTPEKREFLKKRFPQLTDRNIGNSRDTTFEALIYTQTKGRGVDFVLNSLSDEKLQASIRCLAKGGMFMEIGKYDLVNNTALQLGLMEREAGFLGIMVDVLFTEQPYFKKRFSDIFQKLIFEGGIKPLPRIIYKEDEIEQAFRFMAGGKHMGKVLVALRKEENEAVVVPPPKIIKALPRYHCHPDKVYIIIGGLGGFGLELADWLVLRGARKLVLTSRHGIKTGYQSYRVNTWLKYGAYVDISLSDVTSKEGCEELLKRSSSFGEVAAIFNLAVVLKDSILENQSPETFRQSFMPKAWATQHLDEISRELCKNLEDFVIFSSVSCGRGNGGQTNYGMANSVMERICEKRRQDGLPAVAIEWGAIGEVGLVAEMQEEYIEIEIGGTLQQKISSCLEVMDNLLRQRNAIVSSMVVAEKRSGSGGADNIVDAVANIMGIKNLKTISMHATLAELGMDSMTAVEIKQTLEREFDVFLTAQDIRNMTFARLREIQEEKNTEDSSGEKKDKPLRGFDMLIRHIHDEKSVNIPVIRLHSRVAVNDLEAPNAIFFPGIEGASKVFEPMAADLFIHASCIQFPYENPEDTLPNMAKTYLPVVESLLTQGEPFTFVAYSFGALVALEIVAALEKKGFIGRIFCIDGAPDLMCSMIKNNVDVSQEAVFQTAFLIQLMSLYIPNDIIHKHRDRLYNCGTFDDRLLILDELLPKEVPFTKTYLRKFAITLYKRLKCLASYEPAYGKLKSKINLYKPNSLSVSGLAEDYKLGEHSEQHVKVDVIAGNHDTMLSNPDLATSINKALGVAPEETEEEEEEEKEEGEVEEKEAETKHEVKVRDAKENNNANNDRLDKEGKIVASKAKESILRKSAAKMAAPEETVKQI